MARGFMQYGAKDIVGRRAPMSAPRPMGASSTPPVVPPLGGRGSYLNTPDAVANYNANVTAAAQGMVRPGVVLDADPFSDPSLDNDLGSIFGGGGGGESAAQRLAREAAMRGAQGSASYLQQLQGGTEAQYAPLLAQIAASRTALEGGVNTNYQTALANLASRVGTAGTETTAAYDALRARLEAAAPRAYANLPAAQAPMLSQDVVSRYAQAIGAPTGAIGQAAVEAAVPYAGTADAYNRLIDTLRANEAAGQTSRLAGVDMGRTSTASRIAAQNLASQNALEVQRNAALAQILQSIQGQELGVSQSRLGYEQGLAQALAGIYGSGYVTPPPTNAAGGIDYSGVDFEALGRLMRGR